MSDNKIIEVLKLIYGNYELNFYKNVNEVAADLEKIIYNYENNIDIRNGFEK